MVKISLEAALNLADPYEACGLQLLLWREGFIEELPTEPSRAVPICEVEDCDISVYRRSEDSFCHTSGCVIVNACASAKNLRQAPKKS